MTPVLNPIPEPEKFDEKCRKPGEVWLKENPTAERPRDLWSPFRHALADGFDDRCGYAAMYIPSGTVDHGVSFNEDSSLAYEWSNYRFIDGWINSSKSKQVAADLLDPFEVQEGWFEISLPSLQLVLTDAVPETFKERAENTLKKLPLRDDERILRPRRKWLSLYEKNKDIDMLREMAPLIAAAVEKKQALEAADLPAPEHQ
ncbi:hypothetical protein [Pseudomonas sp. MPB26]|uniref:hypothetical protein n=1 Tax=Pseudomonas sp. MPB26 TaxID=3388491 RepID=UPI003984EDA9